MPPVGYQVRHGIGAKSDLGVKGSIQCLDRERITGCNRVAPLILLHFIRPAIFSIDLSSA